MHDHGMHQPMMSGPDTQDPARIPFWRTRSALVLGGFLAQGCSTLSTEAQLEQGIEAAQRGGVSLLAERGSAIALQDVVGE